MPTFTWPVLNLEKVGCHLPLLDLAGGDLARKCTPVASLLSTAAPAVASLHTHVSLLSERAAARYIFALAFHVGSTSIIT